MYACVYHAWACIMNDLCMCWHMGGSTINVYVHVSVYHTWVCMYTLMSIYATHMYGQVYIIAWVCTYEHVIAYAMCALYKHSFMFCKCVHRHPWVWGEHGSLGWLGWRWGRGFRISVSCFSTIPKIPNFLCVWGSRTRKHWPTSQLRSGEPWIGQCEVCREQAKIRDHRQ